VGKYKKFKYTHILYKKDFFKVNVYPDAVVSATVKIVSDCTDARTAIKAFRVRPLSGSNFTGYSFFCELPISPIPWNNLYFIFTKELN